ncbi:MAG: GNAT family N-acetyltransferase [Alphaproteobacteria bacterium]|nr:MAG: GNAT family N-acetyltransferase [Alphaproteobacteria bacterium]
MDAEHSLVPIQEDDLGALLSLNNVFATELSLLDADSLSALTRNAFYARRIGSVEAFAIALDHANSDYKSPNYLWFRIRYPRFIYVDRIVVTETARGRGYARRLYTDLMQHALAAGHDRIVCEVNTNPPNPGSDAFHAALGFSEIGAATIHGGLKTVRYLERRLK